MLFSIIIHFSFFEMRNKQHSTDSNLSGLNYSKSISIKQSVPLARPYEWTFQPQPQVAIDYVQIRRLTRAVKQTQQIFQREEFQSRRATKQQKSRQKLSGSSLSYQSNQKNSQILQSNNNDEYYKKPKNQYISVIDSFDSNQHKLNEFESDMFLNNWMTKKDQAFERKTSIEKEEIDETGKKYQTPNIYNGQIEVQYPNNTPYRKQILNLDDEGRFEFTNYSVNAKDFHQIKTYPDKMSSDSYRMRIKCDNYQINCSIQLKKRLYYLPDHYIWFSKLINTKLMSMNIKLKQRPDNLDKKSNCKHDGSLIHGNIYKKSKYKKHWEARYVVVSNQGIFSYKSPNGNYSFNITIAELEQLWTNFDLHNDFLVIKIKHKGSKTELAIPIQDYCQPNETNWLFAFYRILMERKVHIKNG